MLTPGGSLLLLLVVMTAALVARRFDQWRARPRSRLALIRDHVGNHVTVGVKLGQTPLSVQAFEGTPEAVDRRSQTIRFSNFSAVAGATVDPDIVEALQRGGVRAYRIVWLQPEGQARIELG